MKTTKQLHIFMDILFSSDRLKNTLGKLGVFAIDYIGNRRFSNHLWKSWGYSDDDITSDNSWIDNVHPEDQSKVISTWNKVYENGKSDVYHCTFRYRKKNGDYAWIISFGTMVSYSKDGNPELFLGAEIDITNIKETEKKLAAAKTDAEQLAREADTLIKIGAVITSSLKLEDTANLVLEQISAVIPYDVATVFILNESHLQVVGGVGYDDATTVIGKNIPYPEDGCINTLIIQFKKQILCNNIPQEFPKFKHIYKKQKIKSLIGLPLISRGEVIGLLSISSFTSGFYTEKDYNLCSKFADNIAVAIVNAILHEKVYNMALSDALTQINNRHGLKIHGDYLLEQAKRFQREFSTLILDIDHFKKVNDTYGHDIGDLVIKRIGKSLREVFRSTDVLARYGGEEFVVLLPETDHEKALLIAERLRKKVELLDYKEMQNGITISIGVYMCIPKEGDYLENLIKKADEYMYEAKTNGRNCVVGC